MIVCALNSIHKTIISSRGNQIWYKYPYDKTKRICHTCHNKIIPRAKGEEYSKICSDSAKKRWSDPKYRIKLLKHLEKLHNNSTAQSKAGKKSRVFENMIADKISHEFDKIFLPQQVCDRICIKDGEVFFVEIKQRGQKLRPKQLEFSQLVTNYIVKTD